MSSRPSSRGFRQRAEALKLYLEKEKERLTLVRSFPVDEVKYVVRWNARASTTAGDASTASSESSELVQQTCKVLIEKSKEAIGDMKGGKRLRG